MEIAMAGMSLDEDGEDGGEDIEGDSMHVFVGHDEPVVSIACYSALVATGGCDKRAFIWRIGDEAPPLLLQGHTDSVTALAFSGDGLLLASGGADGVVNIWNPFSGDLRHRLESPGEIEWIQWHPHGHVILAGSDFSSWMWNADSGVFMTMFVGHQGTVVCGSFTPDGKLVCTGSEERFSVWDPKSGACIHGVKQNVNCLAFSNDSKLVLTGASCGLVRLISLQSGKVLHEFNDVHDASVECVAMSPSLALAATGGQDQKLVIWDFYHSFSPRLTCEHTSGIYKLVWSCNGEQVFTGCEDGKLWQWDARSGACLRTYRGHGESIQGMAVTSDGQFLVSASDDETAQVFFVGTS
ncbi:angio-associated migratory cell protein isoform X1 [Selaginella moellendorffii]|uniref:angio-associated migratory cell protein isoform X1 n=1 Tax=Selaginella moellendorffii TaxID=88036 RepID=UPI000D1CB488|nr:angio-associated migratory cell protein isoform X1 [Selaginella moellendorffii]|eukprot:XP_024527759.1 angio-associated migratory cell protein isoform X1 [Selaginella moellendorffii]